MIWNKIYTPLNYKVYLFSGSCWGEEEKGDASLHRAHWEPTREYRDGSTHPFQVSSPRWEDGTGQGRTERDGIEWDGMGWDGIVVSCSILVLNIL